MQPAACEPRTGLIIRNWWRLRVRSVTLLLIGLSLAGSSGETSGVEDAAPAKKPVSVNASAGKERIAQLYARRASAHWGGWGIVREELRAQMNCQDLRMSRVEVAFSGSDCTR
jgi:hypothetical protein